MDDREIYNYEKALKACKEGRVTKELKELYKSPTRDMTKWDLFPEWARVDRITEMQHEG